MLSKFLPGIPAHQKRFLIIIAILFAGWYFINNFLLRPSGIPGNALTQLTGITTQKFLGLFYDRTSYVWTGRKSIVSINDRDVLRIAYSCNGLDLMVLYAGIILALPGSVSRKLVFCLNGVIVIFILNIIRSSLLAWMQYRGVPLYDFAHHYAFKISVYAVAFYGWWRFIKQEETSDDSVSE